MDKPPERDGTGKEPLKDRPPYYTEEQWEDYLRARGRAEESKGGEQSRSKLDHRAESDKSSLKDQAAAPQPPPGGWPAWLARLGATIAAGSSPISPTS